MEAIVKPKIMRNICMTAHPLGCEKYVESQITYIKSQEKLQDGPKNVLIIGGSAGYGLATRISTAFAYKANTLCVAYELPANEDKKRPATVGWYNSLAFEQKAHEEGLWAKSIFGDAFSDEIKSETVKTIKEELGTVDLVVYSLASGKRLDPKTGEMYTSVLKPLGSTFEGNSVDVVTGQLYKVKLDPASEEEKSHTIKVMGGEDWNLWIETLLDEGVLSENSITVAFSYIGPEITSPLYRAGTIGKAKEDLEQTAMEIDRKMQNAGLGRAYVSVNKGLVTRASLVIPVVPIYMSLLYKVMKEKGIHESCIHQMYRFCKEKVYNGKGVKTDEEHRIRLDDWEMRKEVQDEILSLWNSVTEENFSKISDYEGFRKEFYQIHGFEWTDIDYEKAVKL